MNEKGTKRIGLLYGSIVAVCFLYAGSAYMSQFYRLMDFYDAQAVDIITSCWNYLLQAAGILIFMLMLKAKPAIFGDKRIFALTLVTGLPFMAAILLSQSGWVIVLTGCVFHLHVGFYFGFYLTLFAVYAEKKHAALLYGGAYAFGSVGTYLLSLPEQGVFLTSKWIVLLYAALAAAAILLVLSGAPVETSSRKESAQAKAPVGLLCAIVAVMTVISVIGSGLYYSLPQAANINWNLIRAFYAVGLMASGAIMDKDRRVGEILAAASLVYPLVAFALIGEGLNGTVALAFSYLFRGCLTVYYVIVFTDAASESGRPFLAPLGLLLSRLTEAILTLLLMSLHIANLIQIAVMALFTVPLIALIALRQKRCIPKANAPVSEQKQKALFAEAHKLTAREAQILSMISEGLTDDEISARIHISRSTVRFHVSNILKKTDTASRVEAARAMQKYI